MYFSWIRCSSVMKSLSRRRVFLFFVGAVFAVTFMTMFKVEHFKRSSEFAMNGRLSKTMMTFESSGRQPLVRTQKLILLVNDSNYNPVPEGDYVFQGCPVSSCNLSQDMDVYRKADALLLERFDKRLLKVLTPKPSHQIWIARGLEPPPINTYLKMFDFRSAWGLINWTMFYRLDSTLPRPYGKFETFPNFTKIDDYPVPRGVNYAAGRTKKVAWFVSNCNWAVNSGREDYADQLSEYIDVDIYGHCGNLTCPKNASYGCNEMLKRDYKFYLAFENNGCKDYITEKFFSNALRNDLVPIVLGARPQDYKALAPPRSYIHVDDFESPKALADYLHLLDKNDTLYNEYFRWKTTGSFKPESSWCELCARLTSNTGVHWYQNLTAWWEEDICLAKATAGKWQSWR